MPTALPADNWLRALAAARRDGAPTLGPAPARHDRRPDARTRRGAGAELPDPGPQPRLPGALRAGARRAAGRRGARADRVTRPGVHLDPRSRHPAARPSGAALGVG